MKYNYSQELNNILNETYKEIAFQTLLNNNDIDFSKENLNKIKEILSNTKVYIGSDLDEFIINFIPKGHEGNLFRVEISKHHDRLHPRFENYKGEPIKDSSYSKFALLLWEDHMNKLLISDIQSLFNQTGFVDFVNNNLGNHIEELSVKLNKQKNNLIKIEFNKKEDLLNEISNMIENNKLDFEFAHVLVDMDKLREDMTKLSTTFDVYNEFDKLEDDTKYCILNYPKYTGDNLIEFLINNYNFKLINEHCLVKNN